MVNDLAFVVGYSGDQTQFYVLNVRDPADPIPVGNFILPGRAHTLYIDGHRAYLAGETAPLQIVELPFHPQPAARPRLSLVNQNGLRLHCQGQLGFNYTIEHAQGLIDFPWLPMETILFTDENVTLDLPGTTDAKFFRLKQLD